MNKAQITMHSLIKGSHRMRGTHRNIWLQSAALFLFIAASFGASAAQHAKMSNASALNEVSYTTLPGDRVQVRFSFTGGIDNPATFTTNDPARLAIDFQGVSSNIEWRNQDINIGPTRSINIVEAGGRVRAVINLSSVVPYELQVSGNEAVLVLEGGSVTASAAVSASPATSPASAMSDGNTISNIDFRRGVEGQGRVLVNMSDPNSSVDIREEGGKVVLDILNSTLPDNLQRRLDVIDFATPVQFIDASRNGNNVRISVTATGNFDQFSYQTDNLLSVEFKPITAAEAEEAEEKKYQYSGERLSLNFQNVEVRAVLQIIADFTGFNLVVSDTVAGSLTLRLNNVPWDHAMDIILKTKGLGMREEGNVVMIAPAQEIAAREQAELEASKQIEELAPLRSEFMQINYAKATDIAGLLKTKDNNLLSDRGSVSVDTRTNTLLLQDTADKLSDIRRVVAKLDVPVRQVLIESRIVIANNDFTKELGVQFGVSHVRDNGNSGLYTTAGTLPATDSTVAIGNGAQYPAALGGLNDRLNVSLPAIGAAGSIAFGILSSDTLVDLELSALQAEGRGEVISSPRVVTSDQNEASIKQGVEIPYQEASSSGATSVSFKEAVLELKVTPQITPDDRILMDLQVNKDNPDFSRSVLGVPPVDTREITTNVLVDNGETVVLGGVFEQTRSKNVTKVPLLGDLPLIGWLFRKNSTEDSKNELLIFVTPRIMKESLGFE